MDITIYPCIAHPLMGRPTRLSLFVFSFSCVCRFFLCVFLQEWTIVIACASVQVYNIKWRLPLLLASADLSGNVFYLILAQLTRLAIMAAQTSCPSRQPWWSHLVCRHNLQPKHRPPHCHHPHTNTPTPTPSTEQLRVDYTTSGTRHKHRYYAILA